MATERRFFDALVVQIGTVLGTEVFDEKLSVFGKDTGMAARNVFIVQLNLQAVDLAPPNVGPLIADQERFGERRVGIRYQIGPPGFMSSLVHS